MASTNRFAVAGVVDDLSVAASADGQTLIAAATSNFIGRWWTGSITVAARDPSSGCIQLAAESALRAGVAAVDWLPAPEKRVPVRLLSGSDDGSVDMWRYEQGKTQLRHEHGSVAHDDQVTGIAVAPEVSATTAASSSADGSVKLWAGSEGGGLRVLATLKGHAGRVHSVGWGSGAHELVSAAQDRTARLWDERGKSAATVFAVRQPAHCAAVAEALGTVLVGDECGDVTVFDRRRPSSPLYALRAHKDVARRLAVSKAGTVASAGDDGRICVMQRLPGSGYADNEPQVDVRVLQLHSASYVRALAWSDNLLFSGGWDREVVVSQLTEGSMQDANVCT